MGRTSGAAALLTGCFCYIAVEEDILPCAQVITSGGQVIGSAPLTPLGVHGAAHDENDDTADSAADQNRDQKCLGGMGGLLPV